MTQGEYVYKSKEKDPDWVYFEGINELIPNEGKSRFFDVQEVEVYKVTFL